MRTKIYQTAPIREQPWPQAWQLNAVFAYIACLIIRMPAAMNEAFSLYLSVLILWYMEYELFQSRSALWLAVGWELLWVTRGRTVVCVKHGWPGLIKCTAARRLWKALFIGHQESFYSSCSCTLSFSTQNLSWVQLGMAYIKLCKDHIALLDFATICK